MTAPEAFAKLNPALDDGTPRTDMPCQITPGRGGEHRKAAVGDTRATRHNRPFRKFGYFPSTRNNSQPLDSIPAVAAC